MGAQPRLPIQAELELSVPGLALEGPELTPLFSCGRMFTPRSLLATSVPITVPVSGLDKLVLVPSTQFSAPHSLSTTTLTTRWVP